jgi:hypothetical protein
MMENTSTFTYFKIEAASDPGYMHVFFPKERKANKQDLNGLIPCTYEVNPIGNNQTQAQLIITTETSRVTCIFQRQTAVYVKNWINSRKGNICFPSEIVFANIGGKSYVAKPSYAPRNRLLIGFISTTALIALAILKPGIIKSAADSLRLLVKKA